LESLRRHHPLTDRDPNEIIVHGPDGEISVALFVARAQQLAQQLPDHANVINLASDRYEFFLGFCAAVIAGQCTLMPSNRQPQTVKETAERYSDCYQIGDDPLDGISYFPVDYSALTAEDINVSIPEIPAHQLCAILFTSGSTGTATPNRKYWETIRTGALRNATAFLDDRSVRLNMLATVPPQHMWGFETSITLPLFANISVSHVTPFFPQDIVNALAALPEPRALVSSPVHVSTLVGATEDRPRIDRIYSATAPMSAELAQELEENFRSRVIEIFGSSETGSIATRNTSSESLWTTTSSFTLEMVNGRVIVQAPHLPEKIVLQDSLELRDDGRFRWLGRDQDMINIAGKRGSLADLNHRLTSIQGVIDGAIFLPQENSKRLAALVVAPGMQPSDILEALKPAIEPAFLPRPLYMVSMLPRQETGKLARSMLLDLFEQTRRSRTQQDEGAARNKNQE